MDARGAHVAPPLPKELPAKDPVTNPSLTSCEQPKLNSVDHQNPKRHQSKRNYLGRRRRSAGGGRRQEGRRGEHNQNALYTCMKLSKLLYKENIFNIPANFLSDSSRHLS